jgi:hypothetical protein
VRDPKYKMRHKPPRIERLLHYKYFPPPMVGDPFVHATTWEERCKKIYSHMMMVKRGGVPPVPPPARRGLWYWECA